MECGDCSLLVSPPKNAKCCICQSLYHIECAGNFNTLGNWKHKWECNKCIQKPLFHNKKNEIDSKSEICLLRADIPLLVKKIGVFEEIVLFFSDKFDF